MGPDVAGLVVVVECDRKCTLHIAFFRNKWIHSSAPPSAQEPTDIHPWEVRQGGFEMYPYSRGITAAGHHWIRGIDGSTARAPFACVRGKVVYDFGVAAYAKLQKIV